MSKAGRSLISAWFRRKATFQGCPTGRPISLVSTLYKVYEMCMWKSVGGVQARHAVSGHCLFSGGKSSESRRVGEKLFVVSMDVASAFDSVSAQVLGDVLLERGATTISAAAAVRENLELCARPCMGFTESPPFNLDVGMRQGGPRTPSGWNQVMAVLIEELSLLWAGRALAVSWGSGMEAVRDFGVGGQHFLGFEFHHRHCAKDARY